MAGGIKSYLERILARLLSDRHPRLADALLRLMERLPGQPFQVWHEFTKVSRDRLALASWHRGSHKQVLPLPGPPVAHSHAAAEHAFLSSEQVPIETLFRRVA